MDTTSPETSLRTAVTDFSRSLDVPARVQRHPYGTLAAAIGVGYVLGGGLFTRLTARLAKAGLRVGVQMAALPLVEGALEDLIAAAKRRP